MRAKEIMTAPVVTVRPETPIKQAVSILVERGINATPVTDSDGRIVGIVSERDLIRLGTETDPRLHIMVERTRPHVPRTVAEVMTREVVTMGADDDVAEVARRMLDAHVKQIPIVAAGNAVGIVARRDLLRMLARDDVAIAADIEAMLERASAIIGSFRVDVDHGVVTLDGPKDERGRRLAERIARCVPGAASVVFADEQEPIPALASGTALPES